MISKIPVVDEKDNLIGYKGRGEITNEDIYRVSALWVTNSSGDFLLARRAYTKRNDPGMWGPAVAGTVEEGETYEKNIIKEAEEELGIKDEKFEKSVNQRVKGKHNHFTQWFLFETDKKESDFVIQEEEVAEIRWFGKKEFLEGLKKNREEFIPSLEICLDLFN